jgi:DNA-binding transcriptional ArsR family regulator
MKRRRRQAVSYYTLPLPYPLTTGSPERTFGLSWFRASSHQVRSMAKLFESRPERLSVVELAAQLGVQPDSLRRGLRRLRDLGLVERLTGLHILREIRRYRLTEPGYRLMYGWRRFLLDQAPRRVDAHRNLRLFGFASRDVS